MVRVRIPNGIVNAPQLRTLADLTERHARGIADLTVRQNVQLHWVTIEDLPALIHALWRAGLTSLGACGDVTRKVTGCPLAGVDADEVLDASPLVLEATHLLNGNPEFYNLPRKYKVTITGCRAWCSYPEINDVGLTALRHPASGEPGFSLRVGGGLSTDPRLGARLDAFVRWHRAVPVVRAVTDAAERHGDGQLRTTTMQNVVVVNVRRERVAALARELAEAGLPTGGSPFRRDTIACTGTEFCKLALTETKGFAKRLVEDLERRLPSFQEHVKLHVTGCPNSCGQHWIADIGVEGKKLKIDGALVDAYYFCVGGALGARQAVARPIGLRVPATEVAPAIERLLREYLATRRDGETFRAFAARHDDATLRALLAGSPVPAVERDPAGGLLPAGVDA